MIEYRCYDKNEGFMLNWEHLLEAGDLKEMLKHGHENDDDYSELMQFIGIHDKHGRKIFEGDILKITNTARFMEGEKDITCYSEVRIIDAHPYVWADPVFDGEKTRKGAKLLFRGSGNRINMRGVATNDTEVVGNIFENYQLLS